MLDETSKSDFHDDCSWNSSLLITYVPFVCHVLLFGDISNWLAVEMDIVWTEAERELFVEAFCKHAQNFKAIADFLGTKSQAECKDYYSHNKREMDDMLERNRQSRGISPVVQSH